LQAKSTSSFLFSFLLNFVSAKCIRHFRCDENAEELSETAIGNAHSVKRPANMRESEICPNLFGRLERLLSKYFTEGHIFLSLQCMQPIQQQGLGAFLP
jgi:hypothetical protein